MADDSPAAMGLRIVQAQEAERQRMAEDIHDGPAQVLTNAIFQVEYLDRMLDPEEKAAHAEIAFLRDMLRNGLDEVRTFITDLRPPGADVGLAVAHRRAGRSSSRSATASPSRSPSTGSTSGSGRRPAHRSCASARRHCRTLESTRRRAASPSVSRGTPS